MFDQEKKAIQETSILSPENKKARIQNLEHSEDYFLQVLSYEKHEEQIQKGTLKLSYKATVAALMINLYREEPILWQPFNLLRKLIEVDQQFTVWRNRHAQMVMRMLGNKMGTGGSSGHKYLKKTADKHHVFRDFYHIATLLVPRQFIPDLPEDLKKSLSFYFTNH